MKPVTLQDVFQIFKSNGHLFAVLSLAAIVVSLVSYIFIVPFAASGLILSHDSHNSGIHSFVESYSGLQKSLADGKKGNTALVKKVEFLKSFDFSKRVANRILQYAQESQGISQDLKIAVTELARNHSGEQLGFLISQTLEVQLESDFEILIKSKHVNPQFAFGTARIAVDEAHLFLKELETTDLKKVQKFVSEQARINEQKLKEISLKMARYQGSENSVLPLASQERISQYASDLLVREQELKLKISENNKMIQILSQGKKATRESRLYGIGGQVEALKSQNVISRNQLAQTQEALKKIREQTKSLPFEKLIYEDLKKRSEVEFARYKELADLESKLSAQMISVDAKFELFRVPDFLTTVPVISFVKLLGLSLIFAFLFGSGLIYLKFILHQESKESVQGVRDVMFFRDHSFDPSVILENSKIRFSLQKFLEENKEGNNLPQVDEGKN